MPRACVGPDCRLARLPLGRLPPTARPRPERRQRPRAVGPAAAGRRDCGPPTGSGRRSWRSSGLRFAPSQWPGKARPLPPWTSGCGVLVRAARGSAASEHRRDQQERNPDAEAKRRQATKCLHLEPPSRLVAHGLPNVVRTRRVREPGRHTACAAYIGKLRPTVSISVASKKGNHPAVKGDWLRRLDRPSRRNRAISVTVPDPLSQACRGGHRVGRTFPISTLVGIGCQPSAFSGEPPQLVSNFCLSVFVKATAET